MSQIRLLVSTLKKQLKAHGYTYLQVAEALELSEATIKRSFAEASFSLARLEAICQLMGYQLSDLLALLKTEQPRLQQLTLAQEQQIVDDNLLLLVAVSVINGCGFRDLLELYAISEAELIRALAQMDRLQLIDLLPRNRIKLKVSPNFRWIANGPIQRFFLQRVKEDFFNSRFDQDDEKLLVLTALLSHASNQELQNRLSLLARQFAELQQEDMSLPMSERNGATLVMALRRWQYSGFEAYKPKP
ncbi:helix-turn-helix domain-containing protein [Teredinibacter waterburyi]|jgi:hypothetical protein|uniref:helix-turn-helix domain-containing protein n=1 Tax=Teredinibacter waterburyi TaxID=1500538 RepID=UPI00165FDD3A|nr:helix-turn-helix transcriptional regulator [Teredinibacter waterburyi]